MIAIFDNNDSEYLAWLLANPNGYVVNMRHGYTPAYMVLHRSHCTTVNPSTSSSDPGAFTERDYLKAAVILKERIELLKDQYGTLEQRLTASETAKAELPAEKQAIESDCYKLEDCVTGLEAQLVERDGQRLDAAQERILGALVAFNTHISISKVAELTEVGEQFALYHLTEMEKIRLVHGP